MKGSWTQSRRIVSKYPLVQNIVSRPIVKRWFPGLYRIFMFYVFKCCVACWNGVNWRCDCFNSIWLWTKEIYRLLIWMFKPCGKFWVAAFFLSSKTVIMYPLNHKVYSIHCHCIGTLVQYIFNMWGFKKVKIK